MIIRDRCREEYDGNKDEMQRNSKEAGGTFVWKASGED